MSSYIFTPVFTENFSVASNPLDPANFSTVPTYSPTRATGGTGRATTTAAVCASEYTGSLAGTLGLNTYCSFKLNHLVIGSTAEFDLLTQIQPVTGDSYLGGVLDNGDGTLQISILVEDADVGPIILATIPSYSTWAIGDVWTFANLGFNFYLFQNGNLVLQANDPAQTFTGNVVGFDFSPINTTNDVNTNLVTVGNFSIQTVGNPTAGTVGVGSFSGATIQQAFTNPSSLDIMQVVNEGLKVVWNIDKNGNQNTNPTNPTPTALMVYYGSSFAQAFSANPDSLDILQVVGQGGRVVYSVDYQGNAGTH